VPAQVKTPTSAAQAAQRPENREKTASVQTTDKAPPVAQDAPVNAVLQYLAKEREALRVVRNISKAENNAIWKAQVAALTEAKLAPAKALTDYTQQEAENLVGAMYAKFTPTGTVLKDDGQTA
jgi:predicted secreted protein